MSQQELAARAGLRREKLNRLENKDQNIGFSELCRLLDVLGLELHVREKAEYQPQSVHAAHQLVPQEFHKASLIDGSKARILSWGKVPR